jgi:NAD(P)-dependent dehydrogenase (short-subunit alcohol dehydrogenase family)
MPGVELVPIDVTDADSVAAAARTVRDAVGAGGGLRAVVNNAGVIVQGPLELVSPTELRRQFEVNTLGPAYVIQAFVPLLRAGAGRIVNVSAPTARVRVPFMASLGASKAALESLSDAVRLELARWDIPISIVEPGGTDTAIFATAQAAADIALKDADPAVLALYADQIAVVAAAATRQRLGPTGPVAAAVLAAVAARRPRRRYRAGRDVALFALLARLPVGVRDRLVTAAFGLGRARRVTGTV